RDDVEVVVYPSTIGQAELLPLLGDAHAIALSVTPFRGPEIEASPHLMVCARIGVGYDAVDVAALTARRIPLMVTGTANSTSVAEQAVAFIFALAKRGPALDRLVREGRWGDRHTTLTMEITGKTVLVVGFGRIGTRSARKLAALDLNVLVHDPYVPAETIRAAGYEPAADLDAALPGVDFVTIHCPKTPQTIGLFNATRLARLKPSAYIVNTARGGIIDEAALYEALVAGRLAGAGLDVFDVEPTPLSNALLTLDRVIAAPHMAGVTVESVAGMAEATARNMLSVIDGAPNRENVVNTEVLG
ncbi:MAG: hydroxyacid dehydrogenase, partial [Alphaproteobacteria bacterium]|nr:hydroxyacid dehydrogenase [Alphaproteobacteria bacterium]